MSRSVLAFSLFLCLTTLAVAKDDAQVGDVIQLRLPAEMKLKYEEAKAGISLTPVTPYTDRDRSIYARLAKDNDGWKLEHMSEWKVNGDALLITVEARIDLKSIETEPLAKPNLISADDQKAFEKHMHGNLPKPTRFVDVSRPNDVKMRFWRLVK